MSRDVDRIRSLIQGIQIKEPKLYEALSAIARKLDDLDINVNEVQSELRAVPVTGLAIAPDVTVASYTLTRRNVKLQWEQPDFSIFLYEIRIGSVWASATKVLTTATLSALFDPIIVGTTRYLIKGIDFDGNYSTNAYVLDVVIPVIGVISVTTQVIDNTVLLTWNEPTTTFDIERYEVRRGSTLIGSIRGIFTTIFETTGGTYQYKIKAIDLFGNMSAEAIVDAVVRQPPDFNLLASQNDDLAGTKVNTKIDNSRLLCNIDLVETFQQHFDNNSWASPQAQVNAGFPIFIQPAKTTGSYEKKFDFGSILTNLIINLAWNQNQISGSTTVSTEIKVSDDDITYTSYVTARSLYAASARYVMVKVTFTGATTAALLEFYDFKCSIDVKRETDAGQASAVSTDSGGTTVNFTKTFKDIDSIEATVKQTVERIVVIDFVDAPNPTSFKVLVFDAAGVRKSETVHWIAKGIV